MDPITTALVAALANIGNDVIKDSYSALKAGLKKKFGEKSDLLDAVTKIEEQPTSQARTVLLREEVDSARVNDDEDLVRLAKSLLEKVKEQPGGQTIIQTIRNVTYAATSATGSANVNIITNHEAFKDS